MLGSLVLDDLQASNAGALFAGTTQEEAAITSRPQRDGTGGREVDLRIQIFGDPHGVLEDGCADVFAGVDVNAAIERDEFPRPGPIVASGLVQCFADKMKRHFLTFAYLKYVKVIGHPRDFKGKLEL